MPSAALNGEIMSPITYSEASCSRAASRQRGAVSGWMWATISSTTTECWATENACSPIVWPFQRATRARPWAMSSISMSMGDGSSRSSRRPDSMRCQARGSSTATRVRFNCSGTIFAPELLHRLVAVAGHQMVVDHADRLHEGVDDGRAAELEAALRQFLGDGARGRGLVRNLLGGFVVVD